MKCPLKKLNSIEAKEHLVECEVILSEKKNILKSILSS